MPLPKDATTALVESELRDKLARIEEHLNADCLGFLGPIAFESDDLVRDVVEGRTARRKALAVILETEGGYIEVVERIVRVFRTHYERVEFIVPNFAMSAGTVLVMSGDAIHMDYYSMLGPIDPQVPRRDGNGMVPALGYLAEYVRLIKKSERGELTAAEMAFLVEKFDPAELHDYNQARELSISLLKEWLVKYKFKDWSVTEGSKTEVTPAMKEARAKEIAKALNKTTRWHSHGRGIPMRLIADELKLKIEDMGSVPEFHKAVREYHRLIKNYVLKIGSHFVLHCPELYLSVD